MRVALLGDIAFYGKYSMDGNPSVQDYFASAAEYLAGFDHVIGNLETPFAADVKPRGAKSAHIKSHPMNVELLRLLNIGIVNLANNHIFDYGVEGYRCTLDLLEQYDIRYFGVEDIQLQLASPAGTVALHGYCSYNTNPLGMSRKGGIGVNPLDARRVEERLTENHERGFVNILSIHSGQEHVNYPSRDDIRMARRFAETCPYVYYGHHPHVMQGVEMYRGALIAYSLGNFCFDDVYTDKSDSPLVKQSPNNRSAFILELTIEGGEVRGHGMTPIYASGDSLVIGAEGLRERIDEYSAALEDPEPGYSERRNALIAEFISGRKSMRDLEWYLKRLNFKSAAMIALSRYNQYQYKKNVEEYLATSA